MGITTKEWDLAYRHATTLAVRFASHNIDFHLDDLLYIADGAVYDAYIKYNPDRGKAFPSYVWFKAGTALWSYIWHERKRLHFKNRSNVIVDSAGYDEDDIGPRYRFSVPSFENAILKRIDFEHKWPSLTTLQQQCFATYCMGYSVYEIANELQCDFSNVSSHIRRARRKLGLGQLLRRGYGS